MFEEQACSLISSSLFLGEAVREVGSVAVESADRIRFWAARLWGPTWDTWLLWASV